MATPCNSSSSGQSMQDNAFSGIANLIKLLPTGTVFVFEFLSPVVTNNGDCLPLNTYLSAILIGICGISCVLSSFTDSYTDDKGNTYHGVATPRGLWLFTPSDSEKPRGDLSKYKLRSGDFIHAFLSLIVFAVVVLLDGNSLRCFYPSLRSDQSALVMGLPTLVGVIASPVFVMFPSKRHGIGYAPSLIQSPLLEKLLS